MIGHDSSLLNLVGHSTGALVFGIFLFLLTRDRAGARLPEGRLTFAAAGLAFVWNLGALTLNALSAKPSPVTVGVELVSYTSLSLLAPVLLHLTLGRLGPLTLAGYAAGIAAVALHSAEVVLHRPSFHLYALSVIAVGLGGVTVASAVHLARSARTDRQSLARRVLGAAFLFVFMVTYVHLGLEHGAPTWSNELVLHHASVPLALLIILRNHRFVLLDALIRFCANAALAGAFTLLGHELIDWHVRHPALPPDVAERATLILGLFVLLLSFAFARDRLQKVLTRVVFGRGDAAALTRELRAGAEDLATEAAYLPWAADRVAAFMKAALIPSEPGLDARLRSARVNAPVLTVHLPELRKALEADSAEAIVPLWFSDADASFLLLGRRRGGQPYMSEDLRHLAQSAAIIVERVRTFREAEMRRLADHAELRALQAQINPHFLFNALNAIYALVPKQAAEARRTLLNLADVFRYFLRNEDTVIPLEEELRIVEAYLQIEAVRLGGKLRTRIDVAPDALRVPIPKLSVQPLVENAVKHAIAPRTAGGLVRIAAEVSGAGLTICVEDSAAGPAPASPPPTQGPGVGLHNVERRLQLNYGPDCRVGIESGPGGTSVRFTIPVHKAEGVPA